MPSKFAAPRNARQMRGPRRIPAQGPQTPPPAQGSGVNPTAVGAQRTGDPPQTPRDAGRITDKPSPLLGNTGSGYNSKRKGKGKSRGNARKASKPPPTPAQAAQAREDAEKRAARAQDILSKRISERKDRKHAGEAIKERAYGFLF